ncbi:MAG: class I SAM-dependent methyltransferase [Kiritimatiellia bacterium]
MQEAESGQPASGKTQSGLYSGYHEDIFAASNVFSKQEYENSCHFFERNFEKYLPGDRKARILDIGCGAGHFLNYLQKRGYENIIGIDISPQQIEFCEKKLTCPLQVADGFDFLASGNHQYEAIAANDLLEHIQKDRVIELARLVRESLTPDGVFLAKTPNLGNIFALYSRYRDFTHEVGFTDKSLRQVLSAAGFRQITVKGAVSATAKPRGRCIRYCLYFLQRKMYWHNGFAAPEVLDPLLIAASKK